MSALQRTICVFAFFALGTAAQGKVLVDQRFTGSNVFSTSPTPLSIGTDATGNSLQTVYITAKKPGNYVLLYSAVCWTQARVGDIYGNVEIDLVLNGLPFSPTSGTDDVMCANDSTTDAAFAGKTRATYATTIPLVEGVNSLVIYGRVIGVGATSGSLGKSSLIVHD